MELMKKFRIQDMTWVEIEAIAHNEKPVVMVPIGTTEAQGRHLPMGYDHLVAEALADSVAQYSNAIVAPTICYGYSELFRDFPGTITLQPETLENLIFDVTDSLINNGFTHLLFLDNHEPNEAILNHALQRIRKKHGLVFPSISPTDLARHFGRALFSNPENVLMHGNEPSTSLCMALFPDNVRLDLAEKAPVQGNTQKLTDSVFFASYDEIVFEGVKIPLSSRAVDSSRIAAYGYPESYSADIGAQMMKLMTDFLSRFVNEYLLMNNCLGA